MRGMSAARGIVTGSMFKEPSERTSAKGTSFLTFKIRATSGGTTQWFNAIAFSAEAVDAIKCIQPGEPIAVAGDIDADIYTPPNSDPRVSFKITVDAVLTARKPAKKRTAGSERATSNGASGQAADLNDDIPF